MSDKYYIAFDSDGSPYIEHGVSTELLIDLAKRSGLTSSSTHKRAHKYIQKIIENGKARYFYTVEEWKAYLKNLREGKGGKTPQGKNNMAPAAKGDPNAEWIDLSALKSEKKEKEAPKPETSGSSGTSVSVTLPSKSDLKTVGKVAGNFAKENAIEAAKRKEEEMKEEIRRRAKHRSR